MKRSAILSALIAMGVSACASNTSQGVHTFYLPQYRPLQAQPGEPVVSGTAELRGRLALNGECVVLIDSGGQPRMVAFNERVRVIASGARTGIEDTGTGERAWVGDAISVAGSSPPATEQFISERFVAPPPRTCPRALFVAASSFDRR